jgi:predicted ATPase
MHRTYLFTDIEGSTRLWEANPVVMSAALEQHDALLRQAVERNGGRVFKTVGDAFCCVFDLADHAVAASIEIQTALAAGFLKVRMVIHSGPAETRDDDYFGQTLNRIARLLAIASGEQILISGAGMASLARTVSVVDLGEHLLKDLDQPIRVFQVVDDRLRSDFPPLRSLQRHRHNLPVQLTTFVGREQEVKTLARLILENRLVTVTGTGGAGKTRLSIQCAAELVERFEDGVLLVELAALSDPALVESVVAKTARSAGIISSDAWRTEFQYAQLLIVLDNCEHLVAACAEFAEVVLRTCPGVSILATSRESLGIAGEQSFRIPSLAVPAKFDSDEEFLSAPAVRLFSDRASLTDADFSISDSDRELVLQICQRLDGVPLAIELAAACCQTMSIGEISTLLNNRFRLLTGGLRTALPRQKTLRAMVDWSYDLLSPEERALLCDLSVFSGGWTTASLAEIFPEIEDLHGLHASLVRKSLVTRESAGPSSRFRLLQTIRDYAVDRLVESDRVTEVRSAHQAYFHRFVMEAGNHFRGPDQKKWLDSLELEHDNLRSSLQWCVAEGDPLERGLEMCGALFFFWWMRSHWAEGREWCQSMLDASSADDRSRARSDCLLTLGNLALYQGDFEEAQLRYQSSFEIRERLGDPDTLAAAQHCLAHVQQLQENFAAAKPLYEKCIELRRAANKPEALAGSLNNLANVEQELGNFEAAASLHQEALAIRRTSGSVQGVAQTLQNLGSLYEARGQVDLALENYRESLRLFQSLRDTRSIGQVLDGLAEIHASAGKCALAVQIWSASKSIREAAGTWVAGASQDRTEAIWRRLASEMSAEAFGAAWAAGASLDLESSCALALHED